MSEKYTLITGACGGLGKAFVKLCAEEKNNLLITGTNQKKLDALVAEMSECFEGLSVKTFVMDLGEKEQRIALLDYINKESIIVNRLINNAGVIIEGDMEGFSDEEIEKAVQVNCVGTLDLTKKLLNVRDQSQKFEVLTVSSVASTYPIPHMAVYAATKAFLVSMMTSLSIEYKKKNVVFTNVCPGGMATNDAMKESIKSMGLGGKLSTVSTDKVAKIALKALKKKKANVVPGFFNKILVGISKPFSKKFMAKSAGKIYAKSQAKRGFWYDFIIFLKIGLTKSVI